MKVSVQLQKHKPNCPKLWQLFLLSCLPAEVLYFLILASLPTCDHPKAMLRLAHVPQPVLPLLPSAVWGPRTAALALSLLSTSAASVISVKLSSELCHSVPRSWMSLCRHVRCHSWLKPETWAILDSLSHLLFRIQPLLSTLGTCALSPSPLSLT